MESITVHVGADNCASLYCPFCGATKRVSVEKFKDKKHTVTTRCKCGKRFEVQLNFRRYYRKSVELQGEVMILPSSMSVWKKMKAVNLSMSGIRFKMIDTAIMNKGDTLRIRFTLENKKPVLIEKEAVIRVVYGDFFGCEFTDLAFEEKELGFYLFS